ncbi:MAG: acetolactate synthase large subunit [Acidimicrobiales bacterium]
MTETPNGAQALIRTLVDSGVEVCFTNPGTSEMHFVAALDAVPEMRGILGLFEGVVTGAADGYARIAGKPAATLLHLGPGLGNGLANLHNARRGHTPIVNIVGDHATFHKQYDAPLESDIDSIAAGVPGWFRRSTAADEVAGDAAAAVAASMSAPGRVATLVLPADTCWLPAPEGAAEPVPPVAAVPVPSDRLEEIASLLRSDASCAVLLGGRALTEEMTRSAARVAAAVGAKLLCETFPARQRRGAGIPGVERLIYLAEFAQMQLQGIEHLILVDAVAPVSFFAYPDKPSLIAADGCEIHTLVAGSDDPLQALTDLAEILGAGDVDGVAPHIPERPSGPLDLNSFAQAIAATLPADVIVVDESNTSGLALQPATAGCAPHDWLYLTGGSIGIGLPLATGAAVAAPDRKVLAIDSDGSAMYTFQALWTMAHEALDVTVVIADNGRYAVLDMELDRVGAEAGGPRARAMFDLTGPDIDFVALAAGLGVPGVRVETAEDLAAALDRAYAEPGPHLVAAVIPPMAF